MCNSQSNTNRRNCQSQMSKTWNWLLVIGFIYSPSSSSLVFGEDRVRHRIPSHPRSYDSNLHVVMEPNYSPSSLYSPPSIMEANRMLFFPKHQSSQDTYNYSNWTSCQIYTCHQLQTLWQFPGKIPTCPGKDCTHNDDDQITNHTNSTGGGGGGDGGGGGGGGGGSRTDDDSLKDQNDDDGNTNWLCRVLRICNHRQDDDDNTGGGGGNGGGGGGSGGNGNNDDGNGNGGTKNDPYTSFNISNCNSYKDFWLWDLSLTCQNSNLKACQCVTASNLMAMGKLSCPDGSAKAPYCPKDCSICQTCLSMLNCKTPVAPTTPTTKVAQAVKGTSAMPFLIAVAVGILMGVAATYIHKMRQRRRRMNDAASSDSSMLSVPLGQASRDWA